MFQVSSQLCNWLVGSRCWRCSHREKRLGQEENKRADSLFSALDKNDSAASKVMCRWRKEEGSAGMYAHPGDALSVAETHTVKNGRPGEQRQCKTNREMLRAINLPEALQKNAHKNTPTDLTQTNILYKLFSTH